MISISCLTFLLGFHILYNTSRRAQLNPPFLYEGWIRHNRGNAKVLGVVLLLVAFSLMVLAQGLGAGVFFGLVALMTIGSLVVLLAPLGSVYLGLLLMGCLFVFLLEIFTTFAYAS
ncbi:MAG: hypothetical protein CL868_05915 [Cytophagaceae bacterium]|nr:hypothetical protein [Cytophagaceae bacterium]|tara:strand:- start:20860 stop:21207 length:348 start_codon:yes stop_codon:yes gene_type:complete